MSIARHRVTSTLTSRRILVTTVTTYAVTTKKRQINKDHCYAYSTRSPNASSRFFIPTLANFITPALFHTWRQLWGRRVPYGVPIGNIQILTSFFSRNRYTQK